MTEPHVLIVDDERDILDPLAAYISRNGFRVSKARDAAAAREILAAHAIDIALVDIMMPGEDGLSFIRRVRALPRESGGRVPALALTAYARLEDRTRALLAGFNGHVAKPVEPSELLAMLSSLATSR